MKRGCPRINAGCSWTRFAKAALAHLAVGDLLLAIDGQTVDDVEKVQDTMTRIATAKPGSVVFRVKRGIRTFFVELQGSWKK